MSETPKPKCQEPVYRPSDPWHKHHCSNTAQEGKPYCALHDPKRKKERNEKSTAKFEARMEKARKERAAIRSHDAALALAQAVRRDCVARKQAGQMWDQRDLHQAEAREEEIFALARTFLELAGVKP